MKKPLYKRIAELVMAMDNGNLSPNPVWYNKHKENLLQLVANYMPSGAGFDSGTHFLFESSTSEKLVFHTSFHHMDDNGSYSGWTDHIITVKGSLVYDFAMHVSGHKSFVTNDFKDYIYEVFDAALRTEVE